MTYFYLFVGGKVPVRINCSDINSAFESGLTIYDFTNLEILSKTDNSIFFNADIDNKPYRCSVSNKDVVDEDEIFYNRDYN